LKREESGLSKEVQLVFGFSLKLLGLHSKFCRFLIVPETVSKQNKKQKQKTKTVDFFVIMILLIVFGLIVSITFPKQSINLLNH